MWIDGNWLRRAEGWRIKTDLQWFYLTWILVNIHVNLTSINSLSEETKPQIKQKKLMKIDVWIDENWLRRAKGWRVKNRPSMIFLTWILVNIHVNLTSINSFSEETKPQIYNFQPRITRISRIRRALAALGKPSGQGFRQESHKFAFVLFVVEKKSV